MAMRSSVGDSKPLDVVEEAMVEGITRLGHGGFDVVEMEQHAGRGIGLAVDGDAGAERMTVHAGVRVARRR